MRGHERSSKHCTKPQKWLIGGADLFLVEGRLSEVQNAKTRVNLLAQVEKHVAAKSSAAGVAAAISSLPGVLANSAMLMLYVGEDTYNFAALLGNSAICSTFESANAFKDGDWIKAVVSKQGEAIYAHAVVRNDDNLLFMPMNCHAGVRALLMNCMKHAWRMCRWVWILLGLFWLVFFGSSSSTAVNSQELMTIGAATIGAPPLLVFLMEYWTYRAMRSTGEHASAIFRVFGFPNPDRLDLLPYLTTIRAPDNQYRNLLAFNYERALAEHHDR